MLGRRWSDEIKAKISASMTGRKLSEEHKRKIGLAHKGRRLSPEHREKVIKTLIFPKRGAGHFNWRGGITPELRAIRMSSEYLKWRAACVERDNWTCIWCKKRGGWSKKEKRQIKLHVDHIKSFALYPELRFVLENGRTLCIDCHIKTDSYGVPSKYANLSDNNNLDSKMQGVRSEGSKPFINSYS